MKVSHVAKRVAPAQRARPILDAKRAVKLHQPITTHARAAAGPRLHASRFNLCTGRVAARVAVRRGGILGLRISGLAHFDARERFANTVACPYKGVKDKIRLPRRGSCSVVKEIYRRETQQSFLSYLIGGFSGVKLKRTLNRNLLKTDRD